MKIFKIFLMLVGMAGLVSVHSLTALAQAASSNTIYACVRKDGNLRLISQSSDCKNDETALSWNITGPQGPQGLPGPQGLQGPAGPAGQAANVETKLLLAVPNTSVERTQDLGTIDVSHFKYLRVSAIDEIGRADDPEDVLIKLSFVEGGQDIPGLDGLEVHAVPVTKTYDTPLGRTLHVTATCGNLRCVGRFSLAIYGQ